MTTSTFYDRFRHYLAAAGLSPAGIHVLRHTADSSAITFAKQPAGGWPPDYYAPEGIEGNL